MGLCSKLTPHKSTWSADETPFISVFFLLGTRRCAERLLLIWRCYSLSNSFKSKIMKHCIYETSRKKTDLHRALKGKKIWVKQASESLISIKWLFGFISSAGVPPKPPHPCTAHPCRWIKMPALYTQQPRGLLIMLDIQTAAMHAGKQLNILDWSKSQ